MCACVCVISQICYQFEQAPDALQSPDAPGPCSEANDNESGRGALEAAESMTASSRDEHPHLHPLFFQASPGRLRGTVETHHTKRQTGPRWSDRYLGFSRMTQTNWIYLANGFDGSEKERQGERERRREGKGGREREVWRKNLFHKSLLSSRIPPGEFNLNRTVYLLAQNVLLVKTQKALGSFVHTLRLDSCQH